MTMTATMTTTLMFVLVGLGDDGDYDDDDDEDDDDDDDDETLSFNKFRKYSLKVVLNRSNKLSTETHSATPIFRSVTCRGRDT